MPSLANPPFDPNRDYSMPWQTGMTGLVVRSDLAPDVTSICDLFDPKYKGKVEMLTEMRDTVPLVMKCDGVDLDAGDRRRTGSTRSTKIQDAVDSGQIRRFTGNDYARDLTSGDAVAVIGWSGDAVQLQADNPDIELRMPEEGCMLWSDNMVIPIGAPNPAAAEAFMNYVYDPVHQAQIEAYVQLRLPGRRGEGGAARKRSRDRQQQADLPARARSPKSCDAAPVISGKEEQEVTTAFENAVNG